MQLPFFFVTIITITIFIVTIEIIIITITIIIIAITIIIATIMTMTYTEEAPSMRLAVETLEELDWCLDQLESLQVACDHGHDHDGDDGGGGTVGGHDDGGGDDGNCLRPTEVCPTWRQTSSREC